MRRRTLFTLFATALAAVAIAVPALAGGWAITTLDQVPADFEADTVYPIGFTVLQHGKTPVADGEMLLEIRSPASGDVMTFAGVPDGWPGHYVAQVSFPSAGQWEWTVIQGMFGPQELGAVSVQAPAAVSAGTSNSGLLDADAWRVVLPAMAAVLGLLFALQLVLYTRARRGTAGAGATAEPGTARD